MKTIEFLTEYLSSPVLSHRQNAKIAFFKESFKDKKVVKELVGNLKTDNYDKILGSIQVLRSIAEYEPKLLIGYGKKIASLAMKTDHYGIAAQCLEIIDIILDLDDSLRKDQKKIAKRLTPKMNSKEEDEYFYSNCDYSLEYTLGSKDFNTKSVAYAMLLGTIAQKLLKRFPQLDTSWDIVKTRNHQNRDLPAGEMIITENYYQTKRFYYSEHAIQIFLMWCIENLEINESVWPELVRYERKWDPTIPDPLLKKHKPEIIGDMDLDEKVEDWFKGKITKEDVYKLLNLEAEWVPLYENTYLKHGKKSFTRNLYTCTIKNPTYNFSKKTELGIPYYSVEKPFVNELLEDNTNMYLDTHFNDDRLKEKLVPTYGASSEEHDGFLKLFPAPELVDFLNLKQGKNSLDWFKGREVVVRAINWLDGNERNMERRGYGHDRYDPQNYGQVLLIKSKYLKKYIEANNSKLLALGDIWRRKEKGFGGNYDFSGKNYKHTKASLEFLINEAFKRQARVYKSLRQNNS